MTFHLLFEQSGTFKNVFIENGHKAYDYDILNDFGETDICIDIFREIELEYEAMMKGEKYNTIFNQMNKDDFIIAFFPCTHFCDANQLQYRLLIGGKKVDFDLRACERLIERNQERARYFEVFLKFCYICKQKGIKTIIENPASSGDKNYLVMFSPIDVGYYEKDRTLFGDLFKKPTNFFAINFEMKEKFLMFTQIANKKVIYKDTQGMTNRSMITKEYAQNFYKRFLEGL